MLQLQYNILPAKNDVPRPTALHTSPTPASADTDVCQSQEQELHQQF